MPDVKQRENGIARDVLTRRAARMQKEGSITRRTVLVIEDEVHIRRLLRHCLEEAGFEVVEAGTGGTGIDEVACHPPDAVLLDLGLPDVDGLEVLSRLREWTAVPVLVISGRSHEDDKITALDKGANDYITKPFSTRELVARLRVAVRYAQPPAKTCVFNAGPLNVDLSSRTVRVKNERVRLTATEYALLHLFIQHAGKVLTHQHILREIWAADEVDKTGRLRVYMTYLREKLEANPAKPELFITESGVGYRLAVPT